MTEGTQPPVEQPEEIEVESPSLEDHDQAAYEPAEVVEHTVDLKVSEDTQKEFEVVVDAVQTAEATEEEAAAAILEAMDPSTDDQATPGADSSRPGSPQDGVAAKSTMDLGYQPEENFPRYVYLWE